MPCVTRIVDALHPCTAFQVALQAVQAVMMMTAALLDDQALLDQAQHAQMTV